MNRFSTCAIAALALPFFVGSALAQCPQPCGKPGPKGPLFPGHFFVKQIAIGAHNPVIAAVGADAFIPDPRPTPVVLPQNVAAEDEPRPVPNPTPDPIPDTGELAGSINIENMAANAMNQISVGDLSLGGLPPVDVANQAGTLNTSFEGGPTGLIGQMAVANSATLAIVAMPSMSGVGDVSVRNTAIGAMNTISITGPQLSER